MARLGKAADVPVQACAAALPSRSLATSTAFVPGFEQKGGLAKSGGLALVTASLAERSLA
jgi:hypothetical protein